MGAFSMKLKNIKSKVKAVILFRDIKIRYNKNIWILDKEITQDLIPLKDPSNFLHMEETIHSPPFFLLSYPLMCLYRWVRSKVPGLQSMSSLIVILIRLKEHNLQRKNPVITPFDKNCTKRTNRQTNLRPRSIKRLTTSVSISIRLEKTDPRLRRKKKFGRGKGSHVGRGAAEVRKLTRFGRTSSSCWPSALVEWQSWLHQYCCLLVTSTTLRPVRLALHAHP